MIDMTCYIPDLDKKVEELAELVYYAREGDAAQILFLALDYAGMGAEWKPDDTVPASIEAVVRQTLKPTSTEEFVIIVTHQRRATFIIELEIVTVKAKVRSRPTRTSTKKGPFSVVPPPSDASDR